MPSHFLIKSNTMSFLNFFLFLSIFKFSDAQFFNNVEIKPCGVLYSEPASTGASFSFGDQDQSSDLADDYRVSENGWNITGSIVVESGCQMNLCNETYFFGECHPLEQGSHSVNQNGFLRNVASVQCTCARQCKCSDIHIKKTSCGRAYLKGGCHTCNALYADLSVQMTLFPEEFSKSVEAIRLRKGCKLTTCSDDECEEEVKTIEQEVTENFKGEIISYKCICDDSLYEPRVIPPRPVSYPPLINVPDSMDDVIKMLGNESHKHHPALLAARSSYRNGRSSKHAYILLIGSTGAGKSSAINLLFDNPNVTRVGDYTSTTSAIHEFRIPVPIDELGFENSELRVIDTPGLGDTRGLEHDAKFLATLDNFLADHEELKDRIPNVVLIFHNFHDNRFAGEGSSFVKMIRGLDVFTKRFADEKYSNVIFVLSHFCSVLKGIRRKPEERIKSFKQVIQDYSLYPRPTHIVVAENRPREAELPMVNGYHKLPNSEYYPKNLFEKLELVTQKGEDTVGLGVFRTAFRNSENFTVTSSTYNLVSTKTDKVGKYLSVLTNANIGVVKTQISQILDEVWDTQVSSDLKKKFPFSLPYLQKGLNLRNINQRQDIPRTTSEILSLLTALKQDEATLTLLDKGLNIKAPGFPVNTIAGYSYDVFKDTPLTISPFKLGSLQQSDIGFMIPTAIICKLETGSKEHFTVFENKKAYLQHRLQSLGIDGSIPLDKFTDLIKAGCNIKEISFTPNGCTISAAKDFRTFAFILDDKLDFTHEFISAVKALPVLIEEDQNNVDIWKQFFSRYGTHVVKSIYGGGSIQITLESNKPFNQEFAQAIFDLLKFAEDMEDGSSTSNKTVIREGTSQTMKFVGGNPDFHSENLAKMSITEANNLMANWKKSLKFFPAILKSEMRLVPISQVVKKLGRNYTEEIERATRHIFQAQLKVTRPVQSQNSLVEVEVTTMKKIDPGYDRDNTPIVTELIKLIRESNDRFHELTLQIRQQEQENEGRRLALEKERLDLETSYREKQLEHQNYIAEVQANEAKANREFQERLIKSNEQHQLKLKQLEKDLELQRQQNKKEADERLKQLLEAMKPPPVVHKTGGCLKQGTKILMADMTERDVENLKVGDLILDKNFRETRVLGVTHEFLLGQKFYGFEKDNFFFTNNHVFVGPSEEDEDLELYALSTFELFMNNPLMAYLNVTEFGDENFNLFQVKNYSGQAALSSKRMDGVFENPELYAVDTLMYDIQVDSPTGTYIANGYVCRHEIPPVENWQNTMSLMFRLMSTPVFEQFSILTYTVENVLKLHKVADDIADMVKEYLPGRIMLFDGEDQTDEVGYDGESGRMTLHDINIEQSISELFGNPTAATIGIRLYARVGIIIARYLDNANGHHYLTGSQIAVFQQDLFDFINFELEKRLQLF